jgi:CheY-like chemotaxis protein
VNDVDEQSAAARRDVLIVDDDDDILSIIAFLLEDEGFIVRTARNGEEALAAVREHMPRLVLLDLKMPVMNGGAFVRRFRELYDHAAPIVVMSASDSVGQRAADIGAEDWLAKPFDAAALTELVRRYAT